MPYQHPENRRPAPHAYWEDRETPGTCRRCHLIAKHTVHSERARRDAARAERNAADRPDHITPDRARRLREAAESEDRTEPRYRPRE